jgi:GNAT superfamily N-acetyltransferase
MSVTVRPAQKSEASRCRALLLQLNAATGSTSSGAFEATFDALLTEARGQVLVAEEEGQLLGMATVSYNLALRYGGEYCQLEELIVDPAVRGKNVGGMLLEATITRARERRCAEYGLYLVASTEGNQPFYEKFGFARVGSEMRQVLLKTT